MISPKRSPRSPPASVGRSCSDSGATPASLAIVFVVPADPIRSATALVATLRDQIEIVIVKIQLIVAAVVARVGVEHLSALVLVEEAVTLAFSRFRFLPLVVVEHAFLGHLFRREGDVV